MADTYGLSISTVSVNESIVRTKYKTSFVSEVYTCELHLRSTMPIYLLNFRGINLLRQNCDRFFI